MPSLRYWNEETHPATAGLEELRGRRAALVRVEDLESSMSCDRNGAFKAAYVNPHGEAV